MNLSHLKYFISLADSKHFANTAKSLSIARSTLSLAISNLEQDLGAPCSPKTAAHSCLRLTARNSTATPPLR